jgi:hypothetical protein
MFLSHPAAIHDRGIVPCLASFNRLGAEAFIRAILWADQGNPAFREHDGAVHVSDMRVFQEYNHTHGDCFRAAPLCYQFGDAGEGTASEYGWDWKNSPAVHFSAGACFQFGGDAFRNHDKAAVAAAHRKLP